MALVLKVSPFYTGRGWYDPKSGLNFRKEYGSIEVPEGKDLSNIRRDIKTNALIVVRGSVEEYEAAILKAKEAEKVETPEVKAEAPEVKVEAPAETPEVKTEIKAETEVKVENKQEDSPDKIEEHPKKKSTKKSSKKE